jgi:hypothetical protein
MGPNCSGAKTTEKISGFRCGANLMQEFGPTVSGRMAACRHWIGLPSAAWLWLLTYNHPEFRMHPVQKKKSGCIQNCHKETNKRMGISRSLPLNKMEIRVQKKA